MKRLVRSTSVSVFASVVLAVLTLLAAPSAWAQGMTERHGGEASLVLPDLGSVSFLGGIPGSTLLIGGMLVCVLGLVFGLVIYTQLKNLPVHKSMREISRADLRDLQDVPDHAGQVHPAPRGLHRRDHRRLLRRARSTSRRPRSSIILLFSLVGIAGSYGVAWFGIRINTFANSRTAFASLEGKPFPTYAIPLKAGMSIGMLLISRRAAHDARASCSSSRATTPAPASSASPSASRSAPRRSASRAASSPRSPTSAPTS